MAFRLVRENRTVFGIGWAASIASSLLSTLVLDLRVCNLPVPIANGAILFTAIAAFIIAPAWIAARSVTTYPDYYWKGIRSAWNVGVVANVIMAMGSFLAAIGQFALHVLQDKAITQSTIDGAILFLVGLVGVAWVGAIMGVIGRGIAGLVVLASELQRGRDM